MSIASNIGHITQTINRLEQITARSPGSVRLLAVSKSHSTHDILEAVEAGLKDFGENYYQEAISKIQVLEQYPLCWHFIGPIQSNKTKGIATHFSWVHSLCRLDIAERLNQARPQTLAPLNVCIQVNLDEEPTKSGLSAHELIPFAEQILKLPNLQLKGLMIIPKPEETTAGRYQTFLQLSQLLNSLNQTLNLKLDTLSMGMSDDLAEAIHAGSTYVRVGRGIFGERK
jgi:pyridoxal phosphate enzyme (YggS family)